MTFLDWQQKHIIIKHNQAIPSLEKKKGKADILKLLKTILKPYPQAMEKLNELGRRK